MHVVNEIPHANLQTFPRDAVTAAYLLDHAELFASITNTISKYMVPECTDLFQNLDSQDPLFGLYGKSISSVLTSIDVLTVKSTFPERLIFEQRQAEKRVRESVSDIAAGISVYFGSSYDHIQGQPPGYILHRILSRPLCPNNASAVSKCHMAMARAGIWQPSVQPMHLSNLISRMNNIEPLSRLPQSHCGAFLCMPTVTTKFDNELAALRRQIEANLWECVLTASRREGCLTTSAELSMTSRNRCWRIDIASAQCSIKSRRYADHN